MYRSPGQRLVGRAQISSARRSREPESSSEIPPAEGIRGLCGRLESVDCKETIVSSGEDQQEKSPPVRPRSKESNQVGTSHEDDQHSGASLQSHVVDRDFLFHMFDNLYGNLATLHKNTSIYYKNTSSKIVDCHTATSNMIGTAVSRALKMSEEYFIKIPEFRQKISQTDEKMSNILRDLGSVAASHQNLQDKFTDFDICLADFKNQITSVLKNEIIQVQQEREAHQSAQLRILIDLFSNQDVSLRVSAADLKSAFSTFLHMN